MQLAFLVALLLGLIITVIVLAVRRPGRRQAAGESIATRLENLQGLHRSGLISDAEYEKRRQEIMREV